MLLTSQTDDVSLSALGDEARIMLMRHDFSGLANRFGFARAFGRAPSEAIEAAYLHAAASPHKVASVEHLPISVRYFKPNSTGLFAVVECTVPLYDGAAVQLDLIVTGNGHEKDICIEDISGVAE